MKLVKLTKKMLSNGPEKLLIALNAYDPVTMNGYPQHVYLSKEDYNILKKTLNKQNPDLKFEVAMTFLNYGPNESLGKVLKKGYALIDDEAIKRELLIVWEE